MLFCNSERLVMRARIPYVGLGPEGKRLRVRLSRLPALYPNRLCRWVYEVQESKLEKEGG